MAKITAAERNAILDKFHVEETPGKVDWKRWKKKGWQKKDYLK